jgi:hypothetical protein
MATLRKIKDASTQETYKVTVESGVDMITFKNTYSTMSPETDIIVQLLVYAHNDCWRINRDETSEELMQQLENYLTDNEILEIDPDTLEDNIDDLTDQLNNIAPDGIEYITIEKAGNEYELEVTPDDIRKIFLDLI